MADAYATLAERHGYGHSVRYRHILELLLTPEQAALGVEMPGTSEELAQKLGWDLDRVTRELRTLFLKGAAYPKDYKTGTGRHKFARDPEQLFETSQSVKGVEPWANPAFFRAWNDFIDCEWYPARVEGFKKAETPILRVIPAYKAIPKVPGLLPYEDIREILKGADMLALAHCSCRKARSVDQPCKKSGYDNCIQFNRAAEFMVYREGRKPMSYEEMMAVVDQAEEDGLIHITENSASLIPPTYIICNCCEDCCEYMFPMIKYNVPFGRIWEKSRFEASVDQELCNGCQVCIDRCQFGAIDMVKLAGSKKYKALVDPEKCWGCGVCVLKCEPLALSLALVRPQEYIPQEGAWR